MTNDEKLTHVIECEAIYEAKGPSAVYDYANENKITEWGYCKQCDASVPTVELPVAICLICCQSVDRTGWKLYDALFKGSNGNFNYEVDGNGIDVLGKSPNGDIDFSYEMDDLYYKRVIPFENWQDATINDKGFIVVTSEDGSDSEIEVTKTVAVDLKELIGG